MEGVDAEAVMLLLTYMYSPDSMSVITGMNLEQTEKATVLADVWAMSRFLELCDAHLHGALPCPQHITDHAPCLLSIKQHRTDLQMFEKCPSPMNAPHTLAAGELALYIAQALTLPAHLSRMLMR